MAYILITGATSGIGEQFADKFAKKGFDLFLVARNEERLIAIKNSLHQEYKIDVEIFACDLTEDEGPKKVYEYAKENQLLISVLINNAGFGDFGKFIDSNIDKLRKMIDLNDKALVSLTYYFAQDMKEDHYGHIINVASIASFMPGPYMAVYYASKAFVLSFSLALKEELKEDNVHVTALCPGPVDTDFWDKANVSMSCVKKKLFARKASQVASSGIKAFENNKSLAIDGPINKLVVIGCKLAPIELVSKIVYKAQKKLNRGAI